MKKILFLTYVYPYGYYNASAACSTKIMKELAEDARFDVHCVSYIQDKKGHQPYAIIPNITLHPIPLKKKPPKSRFWTHLQILLTIPIYPISSFCRIWSHYKACKTICEKEKFDLVVAQCYPEESIIVGAILKKHNIIDNLLVIFWDNIYGKKPARVIPMKFAERRQKKLETFIAKYSDRLISLYPLTKFHEHRGDLPVAVGKRSYLGIPSIIRPIPPVETSYLSVVKEGKINILYSGSIVRPEFLPRLVEMLNRSNSAEKLNLIFFSKGYSETGFNALRSLFKGSIQSPGYVPVAELLSVYRKVDAFVSFPGDVNSICSKCYEYMSYSHPMIVLYDNPQDVNANTFSKYPLCLTLNMSGSMDEAVERFDIFIEKNLGKSVPFETVESMFLLDTPRAYVNLIGDMCYAD